VHATPNSRASSLAPCPRGSPLYRPTLQAGSGKHQRVCGGTYRETEEPPKDLLKKIKKCGKEIKLKARKKKLAAKQNNVQSCVLPIITQTSSKYIDYLTSDDEA